MFITARSLRWYLKNSNTPYTIDDVSSSVPERSNRVVELNKMGYSFFLSGYIIISVLRNVDKTDDDILRKIEEKFLFLVQKRSKRGLVVDSLTLKQNWSVIYQYLKAGGDEARENLISENLRNQIIQKKPKAVFQFVQNLFKVLLSETATISSKDGVQAKVNSVRKRVKKKPSRKTKLANRGRYSSKLSSPNRSGKPLMKRKRMINEFEEKEEEQEELMKRKQPHSPIMKLPTVLSSEIDMGFSNDEDEEDGVIIMHSIPISKKFNDENEPSFVDSPPSPRFQEKRSAKFEEKKKHVEEEVEVERSNMKKNGSFEDSIAESMHRVESEDFTTRAVSSRLSLKFGLPKHHHHHQNNSPNNNGMIKKRVVVSESVESDAVVISQDFSTRNKSTKKKRRPNITRQRIESSSSMEEFITLCIESSFGIPHEEAVELLSVPSGAMKLNQIIRHPANYENFDVEKLSQSFLEYFSHLRDLLQDEDDNDSRATTLRILSFGFESDAKHVVENTIILFHELYSFFPRRQLWKSISSINEISLGDVLLFAMERNVYNKSLRGRLIRIFVEMANGRFDVMFFEMEKRYDHKMDFLLLLRELVPIISSMEDDHQQSIENEGKEESSSSQSNNDVRRDNLYKILINYCVILIDKLDESKSEEGKLFNESVAMIITTLNECRNKSAVASVFKYGALVDKLHAKLDRLLQLHMSDITAIKRIMDVFWRLVMFDGGEFEEEVIHMFYNIVLGCLGVNHEIKSYVVEKSLYALRVKVGNFPVKFFLESLLGAIKRTGYARGDLEVLGELAKYKFLSLSEAMLLLKNISEVCVKSSDLHALAFDVLSVVFKRFSMEKAVARFVEKFSLAVLSVLFGVTSEQEKSEQQQQRQRKKKGFEKKLIMSCLQKLVEMKNRVFNKKVRAQLEKCRDWNSEIEFEENFQILWLVLDNAKREIFDDMEGGDWMNEVKVPHQEQEQEVAVPAKKKKRRRRKGRAGLGAKKPKSLMEKSNKPKNSMLPRFNKNEVDYRVKGPISKSEKVYTIKRKNEIIDNIILPNLRQKAGHFHKKKKKKRKSTSQRKRGGYLDRINAHLENQRKEIERKKKEAEDKELEVKRKKDQVKRKRRRRQEKLKRKLGEYKKSKDRQKKDRDQLLREEKEREREMKRKRMENDEKKRKEKRKEVEQFRKKKELEMREERRKNIDEMRKKQDEEKRLLQIKQAKTRKKLKKMKMKSKAIEKKIKDVKYDEIN